MTEVPMPWFVIVGIVQCQTSRSPSARKIINAKAHREEEPGLKLGIVFYKL